MKKPDGTAVFLDPGEKPTKKNFRLHQSKIDRAKAALRVETETEAVERALDLVIFRDELLKGARAMRGTRLVDVYEDET